MDVQDVHALASGEGWGLLQSLPPYDASAALALGARLRTAGFPAALVATALTQSRLRARAVDKFGDLAGSMLFTTDGLEQATRLPVAREHARRFAEAGITAAHDLGCGIGGDAIALAQEGLRVTAVDVDAATAAVAEVNLRPWPRAKATVARAEDVALPTGAAARDAGAWLDPARRLPGVTDTAGRTRRTFSLDALSPSWPAVQDVAQRLRATGAKLSPGLAHQAVPTGCEAQWVSWEGEVLECVVWWGPLVRSPGRTATVLGRHAPVSVTQRDADPGAGRLAGSARDLGPWLYEPDRAVIRAGLTGALCAAVDGAELSPGVGYVASQHAAEVPYARRYAVVEHLPWHIKALRTWVRDNDIGRVTIKKRGVGVDAEQLQRQLRPRGSRELTVVLTRAWGAQVVLVVEPV